MKRTLIGRIRLVPALADRESEKDMAALVGRSDREIARLVPGMGGIGEDRNASRKQTCDVVLRDAVADAYVPVAFIPVES